MSRIAEKYDLNSDWLNDGVKDFIADYKQKIFLNWPNLKVYTLAGA